MSPKRQEVLKSVREPCILKIGRGNNVVQWMEEMQNDACTLYGMTGMFFSTDVSHFKPYPREVDYNPNALLPGADDVDTDDDASVEDEEVDPVTAVEHVVYPPAFLAKLRTNAFEVEAQKVDEEKLFPMIWDRMSAGSQSKVHEESGF